jgi:hypothetical protein
MSKQTGPPIICVPSWVIAGSYAENLRFLKDKSEIQGVELLFFLYNDEIKKLLDSEWDEILSHRERFVFTAHLPDLLLPEHEELVSRLAPIVRHFIVHPALENHLYQVAFNKLNAKNAKVFENTSKARIFKNLRAAVRPPPITKLQSFDCNLAIAQARLLAEWAERYRTTFLLENTKPGLLEALLPHLGANAGLCMDTGHLLLEGQNPADYYKKHQERIGEIHLHSVDHKQAIIDGRLADHRQLRDEPWLLELFSLLGDYQGAINLEVFSWEEARAGIEILHMGGNCKTPKTGSGTDGARCPCG